jgi:hypothetical protein
MRAFARALVAALPIGLVAGAGCKEQEATNVRLNVVFPSTEMAIATEEVQFFVFDDPSPGACQSIYLKRITGQSDLPRVVAQSPPIPVCELAFGRPPVVELPFGKHAILAIASRGKEDLLVGCSDVAISSEGGEVFVNVGLPGQTPVPPRSTCASFEDSCFNRCN